MRIEILFFGVCKDIVGKEQLQIDLDEGSTIDEAFRRLCETYTGLISYQNRLLFAINESFALRTARLSDGDTLALLPPISGGSSDIYGLTRKPIDSRSLALELLRPEDGAIVTFDGVTRNHNRGREVLYLEYEAYETMAPKVMAQIATEARNQWQIDAVGIIHRLGRVDIGESSVAIVVTSAHRRAAFEACHFLIDRLKQIVPIWKREYYRDGAVWIDPELQ